VLADGAVQNLGRGDQQDRGRRRDRRSRSGGFGTVTITKSITLEGKGFVASGLASGVPSIIVNGADINVKLHNIELSGRPGAGTIGVRIINAKTVLIDHVEIYGYAQRGISWENTVNSTTGPRLYFLHSDIHDNGARGLFFQPNAVGAKATITDSEFDNNGGGIAIDSLNATSPVMVGLRRVTMSNNDDFGITVKGNTQANAFLEECDSIDNGNTGVAADQGAHVWVSNSLISGNGTALTFAGVGTQLLSRQNNTVVGNGSLGTGFSGTFAGM
jgi:Right handed beta helix region